VSEHVADDPRQSECGGQQQDFEKLSHVAKDATESRAGGLRSACSSADMAPILRQTRRPKRAIDGWMIP